MKLYYSQAVEKKCVKGTKNPIYHIFEDCPYGCRVIQADLAVFVEREFGSLIRSDFCRTCFCRHNLPKVPVRVGPPKTANFLRRVMSQSLKTPGIAGSLKKPSSMDPHWMLVLSYQFHQLVLKWKEEERIQLISWNGMLINPPEAYHSVTDAVKRSVGILLGEEVIRSLR